MAVIAESSDSQIHGHHGTKILGVEWAPVNIPLARRLQTLMVLAYVCLFIPLSIFCIWLPYHLFFNTKYWWLTVLYFVWMYYDLDTPKRGGRPWKWLRNCQMFHYFRDYFPIKLHKTVDLDPKKNYIMGIHPHGIISMGAFTHFCTEATGFSEMFSAIKPHMMTLVGQFWFPLRRELPLLLGSCEVSKESIRYLMNLPSKGHAAIIVVGGAMEILQAHPGQYNINLSKRMGFVKMALEVGADLVPVFSFGEIDLFDQLEGSWVQAVQSFFKQYTGFPPVIFYGRGIFNYTFGFLPYRRPVNTVVGKPISVEKTMNPTSEQIVELHRKYVEGLKEVFETNKERFGLTEKDQLNIH